MAELATVARPYAEALFRSSLERNAITPVAEGLAFIASAERDEQMRAALSNPRVTAQQKKDLLRAVAGSRMSEPLANLLSILVDHHREVLIGSIHEQFEELKDQHEKVLRARITSAQPLTDAQRSEIVASLERRYGKKVEVELDVDPELLGGARVQVGDQVINASVRDALAQMAVALSR
jgi:F-type H+-transporting ATPase subunit delta